MALVKIVDAGNTVVPAYLVINSKGYDITCQRATAGTDEVWRACKDEVEFIASSVLELLGLVSIYESRGRSWKATDKEIDGFIQEFGE